MTKNSPRMTKKMVKTGDDKKRKAEDDTLGILEFPLAA